MTTLDICFERLKVNLILFVVSKMVIGGCVMAGEAKNMQSGMKTYSFGRFNFDIPDSLELEGKKFIVGYAKIEEHRWNTKKDGDNEFDLLWTSRINRIKSSTPPSGIKTALIESDETERNNKSIKTVLFYPDYVDKDTITWEKIVNYGDIGLSVSIEGDSEYLDSIKKGVDDIHDSYSLIENSNVLSMKGPKYVSEYGLFLFQYEEAEELYLRFEDRSNKLKLEIKTEVVETVEKSNLIERLTAAIAINFAPGVSVDKIRTGQRKVAGLEGDEVIMRGTEGKKSELSFAWRFNGVKNSATAPKITIEMESPDGQLEEKLAIWDAVLNSMQVIPQ